MKISVIMPSLLSHYEGAALFRQYKFYRAVDSFLRNSHVDKELIIVSDGCLLTNQAYNGMYKKYENVKLVALDKQPLFSGKLRDAGIEASTGDIICYLDTDDYIGNDHLEIINKGFDHGINDFVIFDDWLQKGNSLERRYAHIAFGQIGTSNFAHKKSLDLRWPDGVGHDFHAIRSLSQKTQKHQKIDNCYYYVCHIANQFDY